MSSRAGHGNGGALMEKSWKSRNGRDGAGKSSGLSWAGGGRCPTLTAVPGLGFLRVPAAPVGSVEVPGAAPVPCDIPQLCRDNWGTGADGSGVGRGEGKSLLSECAGSFPTAPGTGGPKTLPKTPGGR